MVTKPSQHAKMIRMMRRAPSAGVANFMFANAGILSYTKRVSELRQDGWNIQAIRQYDRQGKATGTWRYKLIED